MEPEDDKELAVGLFAAFAASARDGGPEKREDKKAPVRNEEWMNLRMDEGSDMLYSSQQLRPEGTMTDFGGRFCSIALARGGKFVMVKTSSQLASVDADAFKAVQQTAFPNKEGGSMHGLAVSADGTKAYVTGQDADKASVQSIIDGRQGTSSRLYSREHTCQR